MSDIAIKKKKIFNWIAFAGFIFSYFAIFFSFTLVAQIFSFFISIIGYRDAKKCNDRGKVFGFLGVVISSILLFAWPFMIYLVFKGIMNFSFINNLTPFAYVIRLFLSR